ncbi:beta-ketoacyl synthase N-terminal-like domain-containing protein [Cupriavidus campinensis]
MTTRAQTIAISGHGWEIPMLAGHAGLAAALRAGPAAPQFSPERLLGRKGLRYKERSTLLALCAATKALSDAGFADAAGMPLRDNGFGVVVATNTCNLDTVCQAAETIHRQHVNATSAMDLPNASSNVVSAAVAIRFGLQALNLTVCTGASSSLDALVLAANAIRNGRARRMLVVAVETDGQAARSLLAGRRLTEGSGLPALLEGAGAAVLELAEDADGRGGRCHGALAGYAYCHADAAHSQALDGLLARHPGKPCYVAGDSFAVHALTALHRREGARPDLGILSGPAYGAGVLYALIHHCEQARAGEPGTERGAVVLGGGSWGDRRAGGIVIESARVGR